MRGGETGETAADNDCTVAGHVKSIVCYVLLTVLDDGDDGDDDDDDGREREG
jgi:hypothetical protein